jgi:branched-chain amino acid aminotransferase
MMKMPYDKETLMEAQREVVRANKLESCYLRPIAFYGSEKMGVSPKGAKVHVSIAAWPWGAYLGEEGLANGIRVKTSSYARHHVNVSMCRAKYSGTYANSILANMEATEHGYDEALLLDVDGFVAEGAGENLFVVKDGQIYEPEIASALVGITRATVIQLAKELGYEVKAKRLTRDDLYIADEAFFTGTAAEVTPIREVDGRQIGAGRRGPVTEKIQSLFFDVVNGRAGPSGLAGARVRTAMAEIKDTARSVDVTAHDLPLHCPRPGAPLWARHPRVFLDPLKTGEATCPYCGTRYTFTGEAPKGTSLSSRLPVPSSQ